MAMDEQQAHALATLPRGQAAVFSEGDDVPVLVKVPLAKDPLAQDPPDDTRIAEHMKASQGLRTFQSLFAPLPACAVTCVGAKDACTVASQLAEEPTFQRTFARTVLSVIEDMDALDRLWPNLVSLVQARRPRRMDEHELLRSLATHASAWLAQRRGAQADWAYSQTEVFAKRLRQMMLGYLSKNHPDPTRKEFQQYARKLHVRHYDPFPACYRVCRQQPPVCLYRYAAADLIAAGDLKGAWQVAEAADINAQDGRRRHIWEICIEAGYELVEFAEDDWPEAKIEAIASAARRASLCFGQQMLLQDCAKSPMIARQIFDQVLGEAHHA
jgi:hypothetical protein